MRILILVDSYLPGTKSCAKLIHDLAAEFRGLGHQPVVAAPDHRLTRPSAVSVEDGITVLRVRTDRLKGARRFLRGITEWYLPTAMWRAGRAFFQANPCRLVVYYSPTIFFGPLVRKLKQLWKCPSYLILRDIFPQWAVDAGVLRTGSLTHRFLRHKELQQYQAADVIAVQSPANLQYFREQGLEDKYRLDVLYNWTAVNEREIAQRDDRGRLGLRNKVVFFYGGNIGVAQDMDNIVRLAKDLSDRPDIHFLLVGQGSEVPRLSAKIKRIGLDNILLHPAVEQEQYLGMLSQFDVGLISLDRGLKTHNFPGKMLGYMYFRLPILASINAGNDLKAVLEDARAGFVCLTGQRDQLRQNAVKLAQDAGLREEMGRNARKLLERTFSAERAALQILHGIEERPHDVIDPTSVTPAGLPE